MKPAFSAATMAVVVCMVLLGKGSGAQSGPPVFTNDSDFGPFHFESTLPRGGEIHLSRNIALIRNAGTVYVFEREPESGVWQEGTPLILPPDATVIDFDGRDVIVGGEGVARIYRRNSRGVWRERDLLTANDGNPHFGTSVAIDRTHAIVGAVTGEPSPTDNDHAYIFRRESGVWQQAAVLSSTSTPAGRQEKAGFGRRVDIDGDTAIVQESFRYSPNYIYERNRGGSDSWGEVRVIVTSEFAGDIAIDGNTAAFGSGEPGFAGVLVADRDKGGPDNWGTRVYPFFGVPPIISVDRNLTAIAAVFGQPPQLAADVLARNQGPISTPNPFTPQSWNRIARIVAPGQEGGGVVGLAVDGDTLMMSPPNSDVTYVLTSDIDGDGIRDALDPCLRDPLNRIDKHCRRDTSSLPVVDHVTTSSGFTTTFVTPRRVEITATFTNTRSVAIRNPFFVVTEITDGAVLLNGDGLDRGVGATLSPDVGDGVLAPGESTFVTFRIRQQSVGPIEFAVAVHGEETP